MNTFLYRSYLKFASTLARSPLPGLLGVKEERVNAFRESNWKTWPVPAKNSVHFHASSVGELEMITPLIYSFAQKNLPLVITVFSPSAESTLNKLTHDLNTQGAVLHYSGFSPVEGEWLEFVRTFKIEKCIISKYEAWPGLWAALSILNVPLLMIQAQASSSLQWAKKMLDAFEIPPPPLYFFGEEASLQNLFPQAHFIKSEDPRWFQVSARASKENARVKNFLERFGETSLRQAVLGSIWPEDLAVILPVISGKRERFWVVPHSMNADLLLQMETEILKHFPKEKYARTSQQNQDEQDAQVIMVDEVGVLLELYRLADWAFVGGGFGSGVHSTMEPAFYGIPVACGPKNAHRFPEIQELQRAGQLTVCVNTQEFEDFYNSKTSQGKTRSFQESIRQKIECYPSLVEECLRIR